jgi:putative hydrolase of the HAD superfamily
VAARAPLLDVVLFDVDDTLYSTTEFAITARRNAIRAMIEQGLRIGEEEGFQELGEVVAEFSSNYEHHFDRLLDRLGPERLGGRNRAVLIAAGVVAYHRTKENDLHILPDAEALLASLSRGSVRMGVVSAGLHVKQAEKLIRLGVLGRIDPGAVFFSDQMGVSKPNPKIYAKAVKTLGVLPERALYVGDRPTHDVAPAKAAGLRTALYRGAHGRWSEDAARIAPDHVVDDLRDLIPILRDTYGLDVRP